MKTKVLFIFLTGCLLALATWLVHMPNSAQADEIPEKYRETVSKALEYLAKNQSKDGHWEGDGGRHPVAMTGLVGLALLMEMDNPRAHGRMQETRVQAKYADNIGKAADWLMDKSQAKRDGLIFSEHASETARYMEGHGLATLFLAGACINVSDEARRKRFNDVLTRAVKYIVKAQSTQGGWYHTSRVEGHDFDEITATVIQIQALQAVENVGIPVPSAAMNDAKEYLRKAIGKYEEGAKPARNRSRQADTAVALAGCANGTFRFVERLEGGLTDKSYEKWFKYCATEIPMGRNVKSGRDELTHYYYAQALFNGGGTTPWTTYRTAMFDHLKSVQNKDGSWSAPSASQGDLGVGPVYSTALWCTVLQLDKRSHPSNPFIEIVENY